MFKKGIFLSVIIAATSACEPEVSEVNYQTAGQTPGMCSLDVYSEGLTISDRFKVLGEISVRDTGFTTNCSQDVVMSKIRNAACASGADAIQMFNVMHPSMAYSTCFQANARFIQYE